MKKITLAFVASLFLFAISCGTKSDLLVGKWKVLNCTIPDFDKALEKNLEMVPDSMREQYRQMMQSQLASLQEGLKKGIFEFKDGGKFEFTFAEKTNKGTYKLSDDAKTIITTDSGATKGDTLFVNSLDKEKLEFKVRFSDEMTGVFSLEKEKK